MDTRVLFYQHNITGSYKVMLEGDHFVEGYGKSLKEAVLALSVDCVRESLELLEMSTTKYLDMDMCLQMSNSYADKARELVKLANSIALAHVAAINHTICMN